MRLNDNGKLVIDCQRASEMLPQLEQLAGTRADDPKLQSELARVEELAQLCADGGLTPSSTEQLGDSASTDGGQA